MMNHNFLMTFTTSVTGTRYVQIDGDDPVPICSDCEYLIRKKGIIPSPYCRECIQITLEESVLLSTIGKV